MGKELDAPFTDLKQDNPEQLRRVTEYMEVFAAEAGAEGKAEETAPSDLQQLICELDQEAMRIISSNPFEDAWKKVLAAGKKRFSPEAVRLVTDSKAALRKVFKKYEKKSCIVKTPKVFVKRRSARPFGLMYQPVVKDGQILFLLARICYRDGKDLCVPYAEIRDIVAKASLGNDMADYLFHEVGDTLNMMEQQGITDKKVVLEMVPEFFRVKKNAAILQEAMKNTGADLHRLMLLVPEELVRKKTKTVQTVLSYLDGLGVELILDQCCPGTAEPAELEACSIHSVILRDPAVKAAKGKKGKRNAASDTSEDGSSKPDESWKTFLAKLDASEGIQVFVQEQHQELFRSVNPSLRISGLIQKQADTEMVWIYKISNGK